MLSFFDFVKQWGFAALSLPALAGILLGVLFYKAVVLKNGWLELLSLLSFFFVMFYFGAAGSWISFFCLGVYALTFWVFVNIIKEDITLKILKEVKRKLSWKRFVVFVWLTLFVTSVMVIDINSDHKFEKNSLSQQDWIYTKARAFKQGENYGGEALPDSLANFTGYYYLRKAFGAEPSRREELLKKSSVYFKKYLPYVKDGRQGFWQSLYRYASKAGRISDTVFFKKRYMYELHLLALYNAGSLDRAKLAAFANKVDKEFLTSLSYTFELKEKIEHTPGFLSLVRQTLEMLRNDSAYERFQSKYDLQFNEQKVQQSALAYLLDSNFSLELPKKFGFLDTVPFKFALTYILSLLMIQFFFWWTVRYWIIRIYFKGEKVLWSAWFSWLNLGLRKHSPLIRKFILYLSAQDSQEGKEGLFMEEIERLNKNYFPVDLILALIVAVKMLIYKIRMKHIKAEAQALEVLQQRINSLSAGLIPLGDETVLQIIEGIRSETQNIYYEFLKQGSFVEARKKLLEKLADLKTLRDMLKSPQANGKINYYDLLGISPKCSQQEITRAYKKLVNSVHPDKNGGDAVFNNITSLINKAYGVLKDPIMRQAYDATL